MHPKNRALRVLSLALPTSLLVVAVALAEPARNTTMGPGATTYKWDASGSGILGVQDLMDAVGCQPGIHECDDTLIKVDVPGVLTVKTVDGDPTVLDTDLQLFLSDESGAPGTQLKESAAPTPTSVEAVSAEVDPGYYIARVDYAVGQGSVPGEATFEPVAAAPPTEGGGAPPSATNAPPSSKVSVSKKIKSKSLKTLKGTAKDDGSVAKVEIGVLQMLKGGKCKQLSSSGSFRTVSGARCTEPTAFLAAKGTKSWSYKLKKRFPKGRYVVFSRATDDKGSAEQGFGASNKRSFTVR
jgi:hypothetical protein